MKRTSLRADVSVKGVGARRSPRNADPAVPAGTIHPMADVDPNRSQDVPTSWAADGRVEVGDDAAR